MGTHFQHQRPDGLDYSAAVGSQSVVDAARNVGVSPADERYPGNYALAFVRGINSGAAAGSQGVAVEARNAILASGVTGSLVGLTTNSRICAYSMQEQDYTFAGCITAASSSQSIFERTPSLAINSSRESGFAAARRGKRFIMTGQAPGTLITGGTAFVATAPALMLRINSASYRAIIRSLTISIGNTPGGPVYIAVALDTSDRYTSGGGAVVPVNTNEESAMATGVLAYDNSVAIVAAAAGATTRYVVNDIISATPGSICKCNFMDKILMGITASTLLVYVWAATTAPQFTYGIDFEDVT